MTASGATPFEALWRLKDLPDWLRPERLKGAMQRTIPEFASGAINLEQVRPRRIRLEDGPSGTFELTVEGSDGRRKVVRLHGVVARGRPADANGIAPGVPFGGDGWRCKLPELCLGVQMPAADTALPALPILTDPARARALLEDAIRTASPAYADLRIERCTPSVARYNRGSRCTVLYRLEYGAEAAGPDWPEAVVAKTHRGEKGRVAYEAMQALWASELRSSTSHSTPAGTRHPVPRWTGCATSSWTSTRGRLRCSGSGSPCGRRSISSRTS